MEGSENSDNARLIDSRVTDTEDLPDEKQAIEVCKAPANEKSAVADILQPDAESTIYKSELGRSQTGHSDISIEVPSNCHDQVPYPSPSVTRPETRSDVANVESIEFVVADPENVLRESREGLKKNKVDQETLSPEAKRRKVEDSFSITSSSRDEANLAEQGQTKTAMAEHKASETVSRHPPTNALYIQNLTRPFSEPNFRSFLVAVAKQNLQELFLDHFKTHAFVVFEDPGTHAAKRVRGALHGRVFPENETHRKSLNVDYLTAEMVKQFIGLEQEADHNTKWEVKYEQGSAKLVELTRGNKHVQQPPSTVGDNEKSQSMKVLKLDELFRHTKTKPILYFMPNARTTKHIST